MINSRFLIFISLISSTTFSNELCEDAYFDAESNFDEAIESTNNASDSYTEATLLETTSPPEDKWNICTEYKYAKDYAIEADASFDIVISYYKQAIQVCRGKNIANAKKNLQLTKEDKQYNFDLFNNINQAMNDIKCKFDSYGDFQE